MIYYIVERYYSNGRAVATAEDEPHEMPLEQEGYNCEVYRTKFDSKAERDAAVPEFKNHCEDQSA